MSALEAMAVDIALLCEVNRSRHHELADALASAGFAFQHDRLDLVTAADPYGQLAASRYPFEPSDLEGPLSNPNRFIHVMVDTSVGPLDLISVHVPVVDPDASDFFEAVCTLAELMTSRRGLVAGDVNADARYRGLVTRFLPRFARIGWVDALNEADRSGHHDSYWGSATAYAIDRIWLSPPLAASLAGASVLASVNQIRLAGPDYRIKDGALSDHRPVGVDLNISPKI